MIKEYGVIKMSTKNTITGYVDVSFFAGIKNVNGYIKIAEVKDPLDAMILTPMPFDTIGGKAIKTMIEFIQKNSFKGTFVEFVTFKLDL